MVFVRCLLAGDVVTTFLTASRFYFLSHRDVKLSLSTVVASCMLNQLILKIFFLATYGGPTRVRRRRGLWPDRYVTFFLMQKSSKHISLLLRWMILLILCGIGICFLSIVILCGNLKDFKVLFLLSLLCSSLSVPTSALLWLEAAFPTSNPATRVSQQIYFAPFVTSCGFMWAASFFNIMDWQCSWIVGVKSENYPTHRNLLCRFGPCPIFMAFSWVMSSEPSFLQKVWLKSCRCGSLAVRMMLAIQQLQNVARLYADAALRFGANRYFLHRLSNLEKSNTF